MHERISTLAARLRPHTLKTRIALLVLAIVLAGLWVFVFAVNRLQEERLQELLAAQQLSAVGYVAEDIDNKIRLRVDGLDMIAKGLPVGDLQSEARTRAFLADRRAIYNLFDGGIIVVRPDGMGAFADYPQVPGRLTNRYDNLAPFANVIAGAAAAVGPPRMGRALNQPVVVIAVPVHHADGRLAAVLAGVSTLKAASFLDLVTRPRDGTLGEYVVVAPKHGVFVAGTDPSLTLKPLPPKGTNNLLDRQIAGEQGATVGLGLRGVEELVSTRAIPMSGWFVMARLPAEVAFAPVRDGRRATLAGAALLSLAVALAALALLRRALRPLSEAAEEMRTMTEAGAPLHPLAARAGDDEVGILVGSFNRLEARVAQNEEQLRLHSATYRNIFDAIGEDIFVLADDGMVLDVNIGVLGTYGRARDAVVGSPVTRLSAHGQDESRALLHAVSAAFRGEPQRIEHWCRTADDREVLNDIHLRAGDYFGRRVVIAVARDITVRWREEQAIRRAEQRFAVVFRTSPIAIAVARVDDGRFVEVNDALVHMFGRARDEMIGLTSLEIGYWPNAAARMEWLSAMQREGSLRDHEVILCAAGGERRNVLMSSAFIEFGGEACIVNFLHDVTEQRRAEENLRLLANIFSHAHDGMLIADADATIIDVNPSFTAFTGYSREESIGRNPRFLKSERHGPEFYRAMWGALLRDGVWRGEIWNRRKNGELIAEMLTISAVPTGKGDERKYVGIFTDITRLKETQAELEQMAHYDALTRLPNRALLRDRLVQSVAHAKRRGQLLGVCFLDLDGFKPINDSYGHKAGDQLLVEVAQRLQATMRAEDTVARLGGDEFVILLTDVRDVMELEAALQRLVTAIARPHVWNGLPLVVSASIGVTVYPHDGADPEALLRHADLAMYAAKQAGRNRYCFFDAGQDRQVRDQFERLGRLRQGLMHGELVLHYQPKVDMRHGRVVGVEALIRWNHPEQGLLAPGQFLPFAEENDLIVDIGDWTLREALEQIRAWRAAGIDMPVGVNIAARHLKRDDFVERIGRLLADYPDLPAGSLELEIVETSALEDMEKARKAIEGCAELGVMFALDDFGTGYSSLVYLRSLPVKCLKIDSSFVRDMSDDPHDLAIVEGVVGMGMAFGRTVIAEGVETDDQGLLLLQLGCDVGQGFGIARPMPGGELAGWLESYRPHPSWQSDQSAYWRREDFSLLAAEVDHRHWVERTLAAIRHPGTMQPPPRGDRECRFGRWYHGEGRERYGSLPGFMELDELHVAIHGTANEALRRAEHGDMAAAAQLAGHLETARDAMVGALRDVRQRVIETRLAAAAQRTGA